MEFLRRLSNGDLKRIRATRQKVKFSLDFDEDEVNGRGGVLQGRLWLALRAVGCTACLAMHCVPCHALCALGCIVCLGLHCVPWARVPWAALRAESARMTHHCAVARMGGAVHSPLHPLRADRRGSARRIQLPAGAAPEANEAKVVEKHSAVVRRRRRGQQRTGFVCQARRSGWKQVVCREYYEGARSGVLALPRLPSFWQASQTVQEICTLAYLHVSPLFVAHLKSSPFFSALADTLPLYFARTSGKVR